MRKPTTIMRRLKEKFPKGGNNPVARILLLLLLSLVVVTAVVFGVVILAVLLLATACFFIFLNMRGRWLRHKLGLDVRPRHASVHKQGVTIEGEYTVNKPDQKKPF